MTATTARAGHFLRSLPPSDAAAIVAEIEAAHAALPELRPGVRCILPGLAWRLESAGYRVTFGTVDGAAMIVASGLAPQRPTPAKRKARAA